MFRPFRLLTWAVLALAVYLVFFAVPGGGPGEAAFNPDRVAAYEVAAWQAAKAHQEFSTFANLVLMQREQHRYSWFRAVQASYYLAAAMNEFVDMQNRYERVLPDLEDALAVEKAWRKNTFDQAAVARAQLNWWVTARIPNLNDTDQIAQIMAGEYGPRYRLRPDQVFTAASLRARAFKMYQEAPIPDWPTISKLLVESYEALQTAILRARPATGLVQ